MNFQRVDMESWQRKENYLFFTTKNRCVINMTANLDITRLIAFVKERSLRCYPVFGYIISTVINNNKEFKMGLDENGDVGYWDVVHPRYPIFHEEDKRISVLWTEYNSDFNIFYHGFIDNINTYGHIRSMAANGPAPKNCFDISSIPWISFSSFSCLWEFTEHWFAPFIAIGKFFEDSSSKVMLPVSIGCHHAVVDGYHVSKFFMDFQKLADEFERWLVLN